MSRALRTGAMVALALVAPLAAFAQSAEELQMIDARMIWVGTVERGSLVQQVRGPGVMEKFGRGYHAHVRIAATQAGSVKLDQQAEIDTRADKLAGRVVHIDDRIEEGTLTIVVKVTDAIPDNMLPGLAVDARIRTGVLEDVVFVDRPAYAQRAQTSGIFKLSADGTTAERVSVTWGDASVDKIVVADGLMPGDSIILSDMSRFDSESRIRVIE